MSRKNLFIIAGIVVVLIAAYFLATKRKKSESGFDPFVDADPFGEEKPQCPEGQEWMESLPGCVDKEKESSFRARSSSKRIPGTNIAYDYSYPLPSNQVNCGQGCRYFLGFCWCVKYKSYTPVGKCPPGQSCIDKDMYGNCIKCGAFGD